MVDACERAADRLPGRVSERVNAAKRVAGQKIQSDTATKFSTREQPIIHESAQPLNDCWDYCCYLTAVAQSKILIRKQSIQLAG